MHLRAMLIFIHTPLHDIETPFLLYLLDKGDVYAEVTDRRGVLVARCCCSAAEIVVVGREEEEYTFADQVSRTLPFDRAPTHSPSQQSCRPMQRQVRSKSIQHACMSMSLMLYSKRDCDSYGPIIARAFGVGT